MIVANLIVFNEENRWLEKALVQLERLADKIVILDDCSTDKTPKICKSFKKVIYYRNEERMFDKDEHLAREKLWNLTIKEKPDWVICSDADELFDARFKCKMDELMNGTDIAFALHIINLWGDDEHFRADPRWANAYNIRFFKYLPESKQSFFNKKLHCGSAPIYAYRRKVRIDLNIFHYGYIREKDRKRKKVFYEERDPYNLYHSRDWYETINKREKIKKLKLCQLKHSI